MEPHWEFGNGTTPPRGRDVRDETVRVTGWTTQRLLRLIDACVPESASLEYKEALALDTRPEKLEVLKDLSGMANGGGGTLVFGMAESDNDWPVATRLTGLRDAGLPGRLEDIVRSGLQPPLLATYNVIETGGGSYILVVEVDRSPLGPHMVEAYGSRTFHRRVGTRTFPMTETETRDAYQLALRVEDRRAHLWEKHALPIAAPSGDPWLLVSAVPTDPLRDVVDLEHVTPRDLVPSTEPSVYLNNWDLADLTPALEAMTMWTDGFFSDDTRTDGSLSRLVRVHRDGSMAFGIQLERAGSSSPVSLLRVSRVTNGLLRYMGWAWERLGLAELVEVHIRVRRTDVEAFDVDNDGSARLMTRPSGSHVDSVERTTFVNSSELVRASGRHLVVRDFADRVAQAFGRRRAEYPFRLGELYGKLGAPLSMSVGTDAVYADQGGHIAWIRDDGLVVSTHSGGEVGSWYDGVLSALDGRVLGVVELAPAVACPDDFVAVSLRQDARGAAATHGQGQPQPSGQADEVTAAIAEWSDADPLTSIRGW